MRFADIFGKGLVGALTGIDLTDMVMKGGLLNAATGVNLADGGLLGAATKTSGLGGGLTDLLLRPGDKDLPFNERPLQPYNKDYNHGRTPGITDFDGNYNPTFGDFTPAEIRRMDEMYPIGNIGK